jgi:(E)-4-hydroxy-3-methylbut-2-enyl-diphosphate synthase
LIPRRKCQAIRIGSVTVGGDAPVVVQSMTNTDTRDVAATVRQIRELAAAGCEIVRLAVPDMDAARAISGIKEQIDTPLIADIHFDYRLALASMEYGCDGLRLNPGNIGGAERVAAVVREAKKRRIPIRTGVNAGSMPKDSDQTLPLPERMVAAAMGQVKLLEAEGFDLIKVSLKAFDVPVTIAAYRQIAALIPYPLHVGVTEAGLPRQGIIRSAVGIGTLLHEGIGDTIRVSLTADPVQEVYAAYEILKSLNLRARGPVLVSCPSCGRTEVDLIRIAEEVSDRLMKVDKPIKVAVMGCVVNGPGEAKDADVGIACGKGQGVLFKKGEQIRTIKEEDFVRELMDEVERL